MEKVEKVVKTNFFHDSSRSGGRNRGKCWPGQLFPQFLFQRLPQKFVEKVEKVGLANIFHDNFHCFWRLEASKPSEAIVPEIMEIMETVGFTNNFQVFCYQIHGNCWFQGRKHSKNLGQWGGYHIYAYIYIYVCTHLYLYG